MRGTGRGRPHTKNVCSARCSTHRFSPFTQLARGKPRRDSPFFSFHPLQLKRRRIGRTLCSVVGLTNRQVSRIACNVQARGKRGGCGVWGSFSSPRPPRPPCLSPLKRGAQSTQAFESGSGVAVARLAGNANKTTGAGNAPCRVSERWLALASAGCPPHSPPRAGNPRCQFDTGGGGRAGAPAGECAVACTHSRERRRPGARVLSLHRDFCCGRCTAFSPPANPPPRPTPSCPINDTGPRSRRAWRWGGRRPEGAHTNRPSNS